MRFTYLLVPLLMYYASGRGFAQSDCTLILSGKILDEAHLAVPGAAIILLPIRAGADADSAGNFQISNLCSGKYTAIIRFPGYKTDSVQLSIKASMTVNFILRETAQQLKEVVIEDQALNTEHAHNYVQLNEKELAESAGKTLGETLKEIPGVNSIQTGPGIFKPVIHGVHSQRILILNYGIRQEGQQWGAEHAPEIDPFIASNIVVVKDASSIKYGTDAIGGVVIVNPPALPEREGIAGTINTVMQSNGRSGTISGMMEGGLKHHEGWGWRVQGTGKKSGDFHSPTYTLSNTGIEELNFSGAAGYHSERYGFEIFASRFQTKLGILKGTAINSLEDLTTAMESPVPSYTSDFTYSIGEPRQQVRHDLLKFNSHLKVKNGLFRVQYGLQKNHRQEFDLRIGSLRKTPALNLVLTTQTLEAELEKSHANKRTICLGFTGMYQRNSTVYGTKRIPFIPNFDNISSGAYGVVKLYSGKWTIDLGSRFDLRYYHVAGYDFKNTLFKQDMLFNNVSATAGATVVLPKNQNLNLNVSTTWRPPSVAELYSIGTHQGAAANEYGLLLNDSTNEVRNIDDVDFHTEQAVKSVVTYSKQWRTFQLEISPYANYIFHYIYLRPAGISQTIRATLPYFRYTQTNALFLGIDASANWQASKFIKIVPRASLLRASDESHHDYLIFIPSNRYEVAVRYERDRWIGTHNFFLESKFKYVARQARAPRVITTQQISDSMGQNVDILKDDPRNFDFMAPPDGYWLWNMAVGLSLKGKESQYDFRLSTDNMLNTQYREYTNRFRYYSNDIGRNIIFSLKCIF